MQRRAMVAIAAVACLTLVAAILYFTLRQPPQMGSDEEVFRAVDALFTAVTARNEKLLEQCDNRLKALKSSGKLPATASEHLDEIIATARAGHWRPAAERLYRFMQVQRREK